MDLGGLLGVSCTDLQVSLVQLGDSSHPDCGGIRHDLNKATPDGFLWPKKRAHGVVPVAVAELGSVEVISHSSTINWVGQIHWSQGLTGFKTESSSYGKLASHGVSPTSWVSSQFLEQSCMDLLWIYCQWLHFIRRWSP